ncbi:hypothetical protein IIK97_004081 [Salmonella enterica subsp. enterica serovar Nigeria]|nr:hypothetical protein [Salmonella enterica subsp. enterica serovar Nigeria]
MSVSLKTLQKEAEQLRAAIDKQTHAGVDATSLINTLSNVEAAIREAEKKAKAKPAAKPTAKKTARQEKIVPDAAAEPEAEPLDPRLADLQVQLNYLTETQAALQADAEAKNKVVRELEGKIGQKRMQHTEIEHRRNMGEEREDDAAQLYMLNLDMKSLEAKLVDAQDIATDANRSYGTVNSQISELNQKRRLLEHEIAFEAAIKRMRDLETEFMTAHADMVREAGAARRSCIGIFRFSVAFQLMMQHYGYNR